MYNFECQKDIHSPRGGGGALKIYTGGGVPWHTTKKGVLCAGTAKQMGVLGADTTRKTGVLEHGTHFVKREGRRN